MLVEVVTINTLKITFPEVQELDPELYTKIHNELKKFNQSRKVYINIYGPIPIEIPPYLLEVSTYCDLYLTVDDEDAYNYFKFMQMNNQTLQISLRK